MTKQDNIATLEAEFLNDALLEFVEAMRDDVDATDDEIKQYRKGTTCMRAVWPKGVVLFNSHARNALDFNSAICSGFKAPDGRPYSAE